MSQLSDALARLLLAERERDSARDENVKLRNKLLDIAKQCETCGGTGVVTRNIRPALEANHGIAVTREVECLDCLDVRELLY